jgi:hypothetical protein
VEEEYCWAITQVVGLSYFGRSCSGVLQFGFQLCCVVLFIHMQLTVCALTSDVRKIRFEPDHSKRKSSVKSWECLNFDVHRHAVIINIYGFIHIYIHTYIHKPYRQARAPANAYLNIFDVRFGIWCVNALHKCSKWSRTRLSALIWAMCSRILVLEQTSLT